MDHIGIDVHKRESQIYILAEGGEVIERRIRTEPERFDAVLGTRPRARIVIEASTDSEWVARCLEALGHEVIVADPNFAPMYATRTRKVKTDRRDARALAEACLLGAYRPAHRLSDPQRHVRGRLVVRDALVRTRTRYISIVRALLRQHGYRVPSGSAEHFGFRACYACRVPPVVPPPGIACASTRHSRRRVRFPVKRSIARAIGLIVRNGYGIRPQELEQATQGLPGRWSVCLGENEELSPWEPFSVVGGVAPSLRLVPTELRNFAGEKVSRVENIRRWRVVPTEWTAESEELTPTMKLKRRVIHEKYAATIDEMYK